MRSLYFVCLTLLISLFISCEQEQQNPQNIYDELVQSDDLKCEKEKLQVIVVLAELAKYRISNEKPLTIRRRKPNSPTCRKT